MIIPSYIQRTYPPLFKQICLIVTHITENISLNSLLCRTAENLQNNNFCLQYFFPSLSEVYWYINVLPLHIQWGLLVILHSQILWELGGGFLYCLPGFLYDVYKSINHDHHFFWVEKKFYSCTIRDVWLKHPIHQGINWIFRYPKRLREYG